MKNTGMMKPLNIVVAMDEKGGFGKNGKIPWSYSEDLKHFKQVTNGSACIMGRKTYFDMYDMVIARKSRRKKKTNPVKLTEILPGRECYVISKSVSEVEGALVKPTLREAVGSTEKNGIFVIGGEKLFIEALPWVNRIHVTLVPGIYQCDRHFPLKYLMKHFKIIEGKEVGELKFLTYQRK